MKSNYPLAQIVDSELVFDSDNGLQESFKEGVFYLKIPDNFDAKIAEIFARLYFQNKNGSELDKYKGYSNLSYDESILGHTKPNDQVEFLQLEAKLWSKYFPAEVAEFLHLMNEISKVILFKILDFYSLSKDDVIKVSGDIERNEALQYCIFNHYRSTKQTVGFTAHKDSGFITTLFSLEPGLETLKEGQWQPIDPIPGYFTINLGHSLEVLTAKTAHPIKAVYHRVRQTSNADQNQPDRFSIGSYIGPRFDMNLFQIENNQVNFYQTFMEFQQAKAKEMGYEFHPRVL